MKIGDIVYWKNDKEKNQYTSEFKIVVKRGHIFTGMTLGGRFKRFEFGVENDWIKK